MKNSHKMALATIKHSNKLSQDKILWHFQLSQRISHVALFSHDFPERACCSGATIQNRDLIHGKT
jgi:hypothetical protein